MGTPEAATSANESNPAADSSAFSSLGPSGAWRGGDDPGSRSFFLVGGQRAFALEGGGSLPEVEVAYETWGVLREDRSNAVLVCHALTGDSHAAGPSGHGHPTQGWWDDLIGPAKPIDTDRYFVVASNVLGGCQGTTGPASLMPGTQQPFGSRFPVVSIRDMVRVQAALSDELGIERWLTVIGGSMGGMQVLEWAVMYPNRVRSVIPIATVAASSALQIGYSAVERAAIALDPDFLGGDYYSAGSGRGPNRGLALARAIAQITYRSDRSFTAKFGRHLLDPLDPFTLSMRFDIEGYLDYHGIKLCRRFDANTYLRLSKAMDLHDLGRSRGGVGAALERIRVPTLNMGISSDALYPLHQQEFLRDVLVSNGVPVRHAVIKSDHGHDAFLIEHEQVGDMVGGFLDDLESGLFEGPGTPGNADCINRRGT